MPKRYLSLWFPFLATDRLARLHPGLKDTAFVLCAPERGRMVARCANRVATREGITRGMVLADARAIYPSLKDFPYDLSSLEKLLASLAEWCLRFTPVAAIDPPDGLLLDISGCPHLWGGEPPYLETIATRLQQGGYEACAAIADTIGTAWAMARYGKAPAIVAPGQQAEALESLPPAALRLEPQILQRMQQLGFRSIGQFRSMPPSPLRRRFGDSLLQRLGQAMGTGPEALQAVRPVQPYQERLPCLDPISTATGIGIALRNLLETLCARMVRERKGMRTALFKGYRVDGKTECIEIGTSSASHNPIHLFRLFELKIPAIEPGLGIELFELEAPLVEDIFIAQEALWDTRGAPNKVAELLDNIAGKVGREVIRCYLPQEHHWPERSVRAIAPFDKQPQVQWPIEKARPLHLLHQPEPIEVMVPLPDYPPILFRHKGRAYRLVKADGPERIEQEWWMEEGQPRDYYRVEDESGARYWLFRLGHYADGAPGWFLHGFFA